MPRGPQSFTPILPACFLARPARLMALLLLPLLIASPAHGEISAAKIEALVEALRLSAPVAGPESDLYSAWKVKPENIRRWSKRCLDRDVTPDQFAADEGLARQVLVCAMGAVLREQFTASNQNEIVAVQRAAAWWISGDPEQYRNGESGAYTLKVLEAYLRFF